MNAQIINYADAPTQYIEVDGIRYAYRSLGKQTGIPMVCLQHFTGTLDNWDPIIINGLANERPVIAIDNTGIVIPVEQHLIMFRTWHRSQLKSLPRWR